MDNYAILMTDFFFEMARRVPVKELDGDFDYITESSYDNRYYLLESQREYIFCSLFRRKKE